MRRATVCAAGLAVAFAIPGRADDAADAKALVEKVLKAAGGIEKLEKPKGYSFTLTTTVKIGDMPEVVSKETHYFLHPQRLRLEFEEKRDGQDTKSATIINGDTGWSLRDGTVRDLPADSIRRGDAIVESFGFQHLVVLKNDQQFAVAPLGKSKVGDREVDGLKLTRRGGTSVRRLFFDAKTHLLVRSESEFIPGSSVTWGDYRVIGGVAVAHHVFRSDPAVGRRTAKTYDRVYTDFKFVDTLDPKLFEKPEPPPAKP